MNNYRKLADGTWAVSCLQRQEIGAVVTVTLKSGATKQETIREFVYATADRFVYTTAPQQRVQNFHAPVDAAQVGDLTGVLRLFENARKSKLKYPAIVLTCPGLQEGLRINVAGDRASIPGSLTVLDAAKPDFESGERREWFGRVLLNGTYEPSRKAPAALTTAITQRLRDLAADPVAAATEHGRLTGRCCFCNKALSDDRSTAVGYGQTCARRYGIAWGKAKAGDLFVADAPAPQQQTTLLGV